MSSPPSPFWTHNTVVSSRTSGSSVAAAAAFAVTLVVSRMSVPGASGGGSSSASIWQVASSRPLTRRPFDRIASTCAVRATRATSTQAASFAAYRLPIAPAPNTRTWSAGEMEKELLVAGGAGDWRRSERPPHESARFGRGGDVGHDGVVHRRVGDEAAGFNGLAPRLELRLDQRDDIRGALQKRGQRRKDVPERDERDVDRDQADVVRHIRA